MKKNNPNLSSAYPHPDVVIRPAVEADLPHIAHIARVTWNETYNETIEAKNRHRFLEQAYKTEALANSIDALGHWFYVAEFRGEAIGFGHFLQRYHPSLARAELVRLYVLPDYQRVGRGEAILKQGFADLAQAKIEQCFVSVQESNISARRFYERHGFSYHRSHGQFLGTQIIILAEYTRPITPADLITE